MVAHVPNTFPLLRQPKRLTRMKRKRQEELDDDADLSDNDNILDDEDEDSVAQGNADETKNSAVNKPPTGEELRTIKDATDLYRSNSFKLQVNISIPFHPTPY